MMFKLKYLACAAGMAFAMITAHAQAPIVLKVQHFLSPQTIQHTAMLGDWCKAIESDSNGRLTCQIYPAMQLGGSPPQLFDQAKDGVADVVWTVAGYTPNRFARSQVFELPFMMTDAAVTSRAAWDFVQKHAMDEFREVKLLAVHVHGPGVIFTKDRPVLKMEDFSGLKLRAPTANITKMLSNMGATTVGMPVPQVPEALSRGVIDGAVIPYEVAPGLKVNELTKFASETDPNFPAMYTTVFVVPMNRARYDSLPADLKAVIDKNSGREWSAKLASQQAGNDVPGRRAFVGTPGYTINTIPVTELERWKKASENLADEWVADMNRRNLKGKAMLDDARALIQQHSR
jgi:TRAP-type C4-dicarboxylate transport system substrate-binding protein